MKYTIGYPVWNKIDMVPWMCEGIKNNFNPENTDVVFCFDICDDGSEEAYDKEVETTLKDFKCSKISSPDKVLREVGGHNLLLKDFLTKDSDIIIIPQDDQKFLAPVVPDIEKIYAKLGDQTGIIGGRDGFFANYAQMCGSKHSESVNIRKLEHGEWEERPYLNSGPIVYGKKLVKTIGLLDENFHAFYVWDDYGALSKKHGFRNVVLGMDIEHRKFGRCGQTYWYTSDISSHDNNLLHTKWPNL